MKTIYISIPITGLDINDVKKRARNHKEYLNRLYPDYRIITPFSEVTKGNIEGQSYGWYMGNDIRIIIDECDIVFFDKNYANSKGCLLEHECATLYGKEKIYEK